MKLIFHYVSKRRPVWYEWRMAPAGMTWNRAGGGLLAAGFYVYALGLAPPLARALKTGLEHPDPAWLAGGLLLLPLLLEPVGLRWKLQFLRRRNRDDNFTPEGSMLGLFSAAGIAHMIVTLVAGMLVLDCWGLDGSERALGIGLTVLILKEFAGFFATAGTSVAREAPGHGKEFIADGLLLAYGCVAYTAWWEALFDLGDLAAEGWAMKLALLPLLGALFAFLYLALRLPFLLEEGYLRPARGRKRRIAVELAIGLALGLYPALRG